MADADGTIAELERRLVRYPEETYPVQHATAQFHLGVALTNEGRLEQAEVALTSALRGFGPDGLGVERAKVRNALGAMLRLAGRLDEAAEAFEAAAESFEAAGLAPDHGAARYNLGLARRELGDGPEADRAFERASELLEKARLRGQAGAALRELGTTRFVAGDVERAVEPLERGVWLAEQAHDEPGRGGAANILGLTHLAAGRPQQAIAAFQTALTAYPRTIRPEGYALAKGNLALAHEQLGDAPRARLASRQALAVPAASDPIRAQAAALLERLGDEPGDVLRVLDHEPAERWEPIMREELARWVELDARERRIEAGAWIDGQLARPDATTDLAKAWIDALLELPPQHLEGLVASLLETLPERDEEDRERLRSAFSMAMGRLHVPQLMRLKDIFNQITRQLGQEEEWT